MAFDNIRLDKGLYTSDKGFTGALEAVDPSANYKGTALEGLDAYQRQLKRFDIKVSGSSSDSVEKFFKTTDSAALFPEYISRAVRQGAEEANLLPRIVATKTMIDSMDYRTIASVPGEADKELVDVAEGAKIPETIIKTKDKLVQLHKRGRMLVASYEAIRFQRLDIFTITLKQIGAYIARSQFRDAVDVLCEVMVDDNIMNVDTRGKLTYSDLIDFWNTFDPCNLTTIIGTPVTIGKILNLPEFKDAVAGLNFQGTGKMITPLGADLIKVKHIGDGGLIGIDKNYALEMVQAGDIVTDFDRLIDRQLERAAITSIAGFSTIIDGAARGLGDLVE